MTRSNIHAAILKDEYNLVRNVGENKPVQIKWEKALLLFDSLSANNIYNITCSDKTILGIKKMQVLVTFAYWIKSDSH